MAARVCEEAGVTKQSLMSELASIKSKINALNSNKRMDAELREDELCALRLKATLVQQQLNKLC